MKLAPREKVRRTIRAKVVLSALTLLCMSLVISCQKYEPPVKVDSTSLWKSISSAIELLTSTSEGAAGGNYAIGSKAIYTASITTAQNVYIQTDLTQDLVTTTVNDLNAATALYKSKKVPTIDQANLVAQYTFDQIGTTAVGVGVGDYSGNGHTGVLKAGHAMWGMGVPTLALDRYGADAKALHFDKGSNIEIPYGVNLNSGTLSISLWFKSDINSPIVTNQYIVSMNRFRGYELYFSDSPKLQYTVNPVENFGGYITEGSGNDLTQGLWRHVVVTFGNGHMKFYVNGVLTKDAVRVGTIATQVPPVNLVIGQDLPTSVYSDEPSNPNYVGIGGYFIGIIDEVRIYKSVLTQDQVNSIYSIEKP